MREMQGVLKFLDLLQIRPKLENLEGPFTRGKLEQIDPPTMNRTPPMNDQEMHQLLDLVLESTAEANRALDKLIENEQRDMAELLAQISDDRDYVELLESLKIDGPETVIAEVTDG